MSDELNIFFYGDQSVEPYRSIEVLTEQSKRSYLLRQFLDTSWTRLAKTIQDLPHTERSVLVATSFKDLAERSSKSECKSVTISCILHSVVQIGLTILHREQNPSIWQSNQNLKMMGLCTGVIPAIAAMITESTVDLVDIGPDFVLLSLEFGLVAAARGTDLESEKGSWSVVIAGLSTEAGLPLIKEFCDDSATPIHRRLYISAVGAKSITISGPPNVLNTLTSTAALSSAQKLTLPVWAPFHAPHLRVPNISQMFSDSELWNRIVHTDNLISYGNMEEHEKSTLSLKDLLQRAIHEILQTPIAVTALRQSLIEESGHRSVKIIQLGPGRSNDLFEYSQVQSNVCFESTLKTTPEVDSSVHISDIPVAVIGMAGKFPGAEDLDDLWKIILEGQDLHREIPLSRFDVTTHCDPTGRVRNTSLTPYGCFYDNADKFDLSLFKMSPREAAQTDPMQRMMLITAYMALESAGYYDPGPRRSRPKFGTYYGQGGDDYRQMNSSQDIDSNYITGGIRAFGPGRVSYHFGWEGPSLVVDTACSASGVAINQAVSALRIGECNAALAGGANFLSCSDMFAGLSRASFLSLTGGCKTLDEKADGYCRADGVGTVVLKRLDDAVRDKDNILGVIRAIETNHAANAISITHPHAETQATLFRSVIRSAGLSVDDVDHVETHGTGTQAGDLAEMTSIASLLEGKRRPDDHPLYIGAVKPNVGHSEAASGVTSLMKGLLMFQHGTIPRHTGIKGRLNPKLPRLDVLNICIPTENLPYRPADQSSRRRMLINNFNATGGSTALLLEEYEKVDTIMTDPRDYFPIILSGATQRARDNAIRSLHDLLLRSPYTVLSHLCYTLSARRMHHTHRFSCTASDISQLIEKLEATMTRESHYTKHVRDSAIIFVFTGQGSHYNGMGYKLWKTCRAFRSHIETTDLLCQSLGFPSFLPLISNPEANMEQFDATCIQLAVVALEISLAVTLRAWGVLPTILIGHSLGEYSAFVVSGVLSLADALYLVGKRAQLMVRECKHSHSMLAVAASEYETQNAVQNIQLCGSSVACINSPEQTVVSGLDNELQSLRTHFSSQRVRTTMLKATFAFHSAQMDPILPQFRQLAESVQFHAPEIPVASTLLGTIVRPGDRGVFNAQYLVRQTREPVVFTTALRAVQDMLGVDASATWVELGPTTTCLPMIASTLSVDITCLASMLDRKRPNWQSLSDAMCKIHRNGGDVFWDEYHKEYLDCLKFIEVPAYDFDMTSHFIPYTGNWAITKNQRSNHTDLPVHNLQSTTVHNVETYVTESGSSQMSFMTDASHPKFRDLVSAIAGTSNFDGALCVLTDMVVTAASYLWQIENTGEILPAIQVNPVSGAGISEESLLGLDAIKLTALQDLSNRKVVKVRITNGLIRERYQYEYEVIFDHDNRWARSIEKNAYLYASRVEHFKKEARPASLHEINDNIQTRFMIDEPFVEVVATLQPGGESGNFLLSPVWQAKIIGMIDRTLRYIASGLKGFRTRRFCGWRNLRLLRKVESAAFHYVHARVRLTVETEPVFCDIHVLDNDRNIVAVFEDLKYDIDQSQGLFTMLPAADHRLQIVQRVEDAPFMTTKSPLLDTASSVNTCKSTKDRPVKNSLDFKHIIALLASEIGVSPSSIHDDSAFSDLGVDSLLQIGIAGKLTEYLQRKIPANLLIEYSSVRKLREFFDTLREAEN